MKAKTYSTHFAKLSNLILSMLEEQQEKLLDLATRIKNGQNPFTNNGRKNTSLFSHQVSWQAGDWSQCFF
jgi:uncharacterized protein YpbB